MSWQLGAFAILALGACRRVRLVRARRPDARIVALVATLAAFAALGRIAFAALPNVKPTTDIVLISGYALGGAPGFVVGALAGLTSNFFFGQGPWTPWQMAAWGATGVLGAGLAPRRGGRDRPLAARARLRGRGFAFTAIAGRRRLGQLLRPQPGPARRLRRQGGRLRLRPRCRMPGVRARVRSVAGALAAAVRDPAAGDLALPPGRPRSVLSAARCSQAPAGACRDPDELPARPRRTRRRLRLRTRAAVVRAVFGLGSARLGRRRSQPESDGAGVGEPCSGYVSAGPAGDVGSLERTILAAARRRARRRLRRKSPRFGATVRSDGSVSEQTN